MYSPLSSQARRYRSPVAIGTKPLPLFCCLIIAGCSTNSDVQRRTGEYSFYDSTQSFIAIADTRRNGAVVDKGIFYPKNTYSFAYRYCAASEQEATRDIADYQVLAQRVCDANGGQLTHQDSGTWCVTGANTFEETPIFSAHISSTELWADLCLDGPFVTLRVIENTTAPAGEWFESAEILGYDPYSPQRQIVLARVINSPLYHPPKNINTTRKWSDESQYIYSNIGATVCLYDQTDNAAIGYTYRGQVYSVKNGMVKVLAREKIRGDIRMAPAWEPVKWHKEAYITATANSWFVCSS